MNKILNSPLSSLVFIVVILLLIGIFSFMNDRVSEFLQIDNSIVSDETYTDTLTIASFTDYFPEHVLQEFEANRNIKINIEPIESSSDLRQKMESGASYDIIVVNDYLVKPFVERGYLAPIAHNQLTNYTYIDDRFRAIDYDYGNRYSVPFLWGTVGISYNTNYIIGLPLSWTQLFQPSRIEYISGKISILDDYRVTMGIMLLYLGYDPNTRNVNEIEEATEQLLRLAPYIVFHSHETIEENIISENLYMSMMWSGDAALISSINNNIRYALPSEGTIFWVDNFAITRTSENQDLAYLFIDYLLNPRVISEISNANYHANPVTNSRRYIDRHILNGPAYANPYVSGSITMINHIAEDDSLYQSYWNVFTDSLKSHMESVGDTLGLSPLPAIQ